MLKKMLSLALAFIMCAGFAGCTGTGAPGNTDAPQNTAAPEAGRLNAPGAELPLAVYTSNSELMGEARYSAAYTAANNAFAARMAKALDNGENAVFSPLSLQTALQVLANGGSDEAMRDLLFALCPGMTREDVNEASSALIAQIMKSEGVTIDTAVIANCAYAINTEFANLAADRYAATVGALDFTDSEAACEKINDWVSDKTNGLVKELLDRVGPDTAMVILNALTLELEWERPFTAMRGMMEFSGRKGEEAAPYIQSAGNYSYGEFDEGRAVLLPYAGGEYAMAVILPEKDVSPAEAAASITGRLNECAETGVFVKMPKVTLDSTTDALDIADRLGIEEGVKGSFTRLIDDESAVVSKIVQGAHIEVNETGTTAAAATAIVATKNGPVPTEKEVVCDRPYAMVILHADTGAVLFMSIVNDIG